jgi:predicted nucleotidyltransferase
MNAWELARSLNENYSAVWRELDRLEKAGILISTRSGRAKAYRVNPACPITPELTAIMMKTAGAGETLKLHLKEVGGIQAAFIFGSFASGKADELSDIDLMIIGEMSLEVLAPVISEVEKQLNRPVNYVFYSDPEWQDQVTRNEPFALNIINSPKIWLIGESQDV